MSKIDIAVKNVANLALLGVIGINITGISLSESEGALILNVFFVNDLSEEQIDWLESATSEIFASVLDIYTDVILRTHKMDGKLHPRVGHYIFLRFGYAWKSDDD
jgi:hypothetical protein